MHKMTTVKVQQNVIGAVVFCIVRFVTIATLIYIFNTDKLCRTKKEKKIKKTKYTLKEKCLSIAKLLF